MVERSSLCACASSRLVWSLNSDLLGSRTRSQLSRAPAVGPTVRIQYWLESHTTHKAMHVVVPCCYHPCRGVGLVIVMDSWSISGWVLVGKNQDLYLLRAQHSKQLATSSRLLLETFNTTKGDISHLKTCI
jgi:hypothetical protein